MNTKLILGDEEMSEVVGGYKNAPAPIGKPRIPFLEAVLDDFLGVKEGVMIYDDIAAIFVRG